MRREGKVQERLLKGTEDDVEDDAREDESCKKMTTDCLLVLVVLVLQLFKVM